MKTKFLYFIAIITSVTFLLTACNKEMQQYPDSLGDSNTRTGTTIYDSIAKIPNDSLFRLMINKTPYRDSLKVTSKYYTIFVPTNSAVKSFISAVSGGAIPTSAPDNVFAGFINTNTSFAAQLPSIVGYHIIGREFTSSKIDTTFPNLWMPSLVNPAPTVSPFVRLSNFVSTRNGFWFNNIPVIAPNNMQAQNGIIHHLAAVAVPPSQYLWDRINSDANLRYLRAAIIRADSGAVLTDPTKSLQAALQSLGANFTLFAPSNAAFQTTLTGAIAQALIAQGVPPATAVATATALASDTSVFNHPAVRPVLPPLRVKGLVAYHLLKGSRAYVNNFPTSLSWYKTLLNDDAAFTNHKGIGLTSTFTGGFPTAASVRDTSSVYPPASLTLNPLPNGTSDQNYLNGVLHQINRVLMPQ